MPKQPPPKSTPAKVPAQSKAEDLPDTPSDRLYFRAKRQVLEREVKEYVGRRDWESLEDMLYDYGRFLERHPEALASD